MNNKIEPWLRTTLGLYLIGYALNQFAHIIPTSYGQMPEVTRHFIDSILEYLPYLYALEIIIGLFLVFNKSTPLVLLMLFPLSVSFMMFNLINMDPVMMWPAILVAGLNVTLVLMHREKYNVLVD